MAAHRPSNAWHAPRSPDRLIAGVAGGWADRWRVEPTVVRCCLGVLTLVGGLGALAYAALALFSTAAVPSPAPGDVTSRPAVLARRHVSLGCGTLAILLLTRSIGLWPGDAIMVPATGVAVGIAAVWSTSARSSKRRAAPDAWVVRSIQVLAGVGLLAAGLLSLANRTGGLANIGASASAIAVVVGGLAMFGAPAAGRLLRNLDEERAMRIREDERAAVAAHLHDSVLQSLMLMQRTDDPRRMSSLARRQERELRAWLYGAGPAGEPASLSAAIQAMTVEIESDHDVRVETVVVGDQPLDETARALLAAIREALVNAARHADVDKVDVFVEIDDTELTGYVRDTGRGFDRSSVPDDRRGISDSIIGRAQHAGGSATVMSERHVGTEVEVRIPRERPMTIRIVLVEDHALFRAGVRSELAEAAAAGGGGEPKIDIVGEAASVEDAIAVIRRALPDVVLLDVHLPGGGGHNVIAAVRDDHRPPRFLALSVSDAADDVIAVVRAGARGYVTKSISAADLLSAIERVHEGDAVFSPRLAGFVLDAFSGDLPAPADPELDQLTAREQEVLRLIARGYAYKEIAARLHLSVKTIETHVSGVLRKLQLSNRHQLTAWANERRLV